ncbi:hypothetical protein Pmani_030912 [Petrolisthes manimaculis]|uniref:HPS5-like beta-propeller domain-containing protein n=1 Tax=Petrolisthes manimaculis TaxID=1843537 RepID=A0AAE1NUP4_9EUCA|nr:hypothetical protein Pmani_030912 [Petrolisthes manimaculis]
MSSDLVVLETSDLQQLSFLHQGITRLKIVCFDLCPSLILLGANSGTIYVLDHETLTLKTQIPSGSGSVVQLSISSDESLVACALSSGLVQVFELPVSDGGDGGGGSGGGAWRAVVMSREHEGKEVTSLAWEQANAEVYISDTSGKVSVLYVTRSKTASLFRSASMHLMTLESGVTSLNYSEGHLLVSTLTRSYICNTALETFAQVGTRLRQGEYGGCFCRAAPGNGITQHDFTESVEDARIFERSLNERLMLSDCYEAIEEDQDSQARMAMEGKSSSSQMIEGKGSDVVTGKPTSKIFCARPGTRIWEADHSGKVLVTHQLKSALMVPPADVLLTDGSFGEQELLQEIQKMPEADPITSHDNSSLKNTDHQPPEANVTPDHSSKRGPPGPLHPPVSVAFTKMLSFYSNYLLAISNYGLYIIDPANSKVLLWINVLDSVTDIKVSGSSLIFKTGSGCIKNFMVTPVDVAILFLHTRSLMVECAHLCLMNPYIFSCSELLSRLGGKIFSDLYSFIKNDIIRARLSKLKSTAKFDKPKTGTTKIVSKAGVTVVRNKNYENEEIKEGLMSALMRSHSHIFLSSVSRWYSEPVLGGRRRKSIGAQRHTASVENSPIHHIHSTSTSTFLYEASSCRSLTQFSSEDTLQSNSSRKSLVAEQSAIDSPEKKSHSPESDEDKRLDHLTLSSGRCSQESDSRSSHKSLESLDMYEDPLFPSDDSSPEQELASRAMYGDHLLNPYGTQPFYNLAYTPIHPGSEAASMFQDLVENVATNMVGTIASGTKSLTEKLKSVAPLMSSGEKYPLKPNDGLHSVSDDSQLINTSPDTDGTDDLDNIVVKSSSKKKPRSNPHKSTFQSSKTPGVSNMEEMHRTTQEIPGIVRNLHELVTSTTEQIINSGNKVETRSLLKRWLVKYCHTTHQIQASKRSSPQANEDVSCDGPVSWSSVDSSHSVCSVEASCDSLNWDCNDIGFEPSAMSADTVEQITEMFVQCLQAGVYISDFHNPHIVYGYQKLDLQHTVTPVEVQKRDSLYAQLISYDCGLLHYSNILNALDSLGHNYYILTWAALLEKIGRDIDVAQTSTLPDIIPNLDFTRSQRLSLLYKVALGGNVKKFIVAAAQIENSQVIEDVIFLLNYVAQSLEMEGTVTKAQIPKLLLQYLHEHSQLRNLQQTYLSHWRHCPELQYDILSALLCEVNPSQYSCRCGMPRPGVRPVAIKTLAHTLLTHHLVCPKSLAVLCQSAGYWEGCCAIYLNYNLKSSKHIFPYVLQTCNPHIIQDFIEASPPQTYSIMLEGLADITCKDPLYINCSKCHNILPLSKHGTRFHNKTNRTDQFIVNGDHNAVHEEDLLRDQHSHGEYETINNECCQEETPEHREGCTRSMVVQRDGCVRSIMEQQQRDGCVRSIMEQQQRDGCVSNMVEMWENVVMQLLKRCGAPHTLLLLEIVQDNIPPGILSSRVYRWCVLASLAERRGPGARWALLQSLSPAPTRPYSIRVAKLLFRDERVSSKAGEAENCFGITTHNCAFIEDVAVQDSTLPHNDNNTVPTHHGLPPDTLVHHNQLSDTLLHHHRPHDTSHHHQPPDTLFVHHRTPIPSSSTSSLTHPQPPHDGTSCSTTTPTSLFEHHWGVQSEVLHGLCYCCHLHLTTDALVNEGGIIVFPCSHAFHAICLSQRGHYCVICADDNPQI